MSYFKDAAVATSRVPTKTIWLWNWCWNCLWCWSIVIHYSLLGFVRTFTHKHTLKYMHKSRTCTYIYIYKHKHTFTYLLPIRVGNTFYDVLYASLALGCWLVGWSVGWLVWLVAFVFLSLLLCVQAGIYQWLCWVLSIYDVFK